MRLIAIADLHYDADAHERMRDLARMINREGGDVLVVAGDCCAEGPALLGEVLGHFEDFPGERLMVPGNHDLWEDHPPFSTEQVYRETIPGIASEHGFHCLDRGARIVGDTAFVGVMGWYDYGMCQREAPTDGLTVMPVRVAPGAEGKMSFSALPGVGEMAWEDLTPEHYMANGLVWQSEGAPHVTVWNDAVHLDWRRPDREVAECSADTLREQIASVAAQARRVVGVTHFVPFTELVSYRIENPTRAFARAYMGSSLLGEALLEAPGLTLAIYGHRHGQEVREVRGVVTADAEISDREGPLALTLPD